MHWWSQATLKHCQWLLLPAAWLAGGHYAGGEVVACYASSVAIAAALVIGTLLLVAFMTAANHVGARNIQ
jgi:hypothetical protein